ncbi:MAG: Asp-tRNA(Asn)/Glu-tRNA(Gln) amidotransferase subunit GatC [Candidatus Electrothrix sp. AR3]|nr:Asp-tRNA(Asn)/Glu-tRNA(Gln) amidotransferase subunit GatC [Candidatus Electrothrix sp. AR3]
MKITKQEVEKTAQLARLKMSAEETEKMTVQLDAILSYVAKLDELDTTGVAASSYTHQAINAFRDDAVRESLPQAKALQNGARHNAEAFVVPKIIN